MPNLNPVQITLNTTMLTRILIHVRTIFQANFKFFPKSNTMSKYLPKFGENKMESSKIVKGIKIMDGGGGGGVWPLHLK